METIDVVDAGPNGRGGQDTVAELREQIAQARRTKPSLLLVTVAGDAWDVAEGRREAAEVASIHRLIQDLHGLTMPVVVWFEGRVTGYGLALALACDVRFCGPGARLGLGDPLTASSLEGGASWLLRDRMGSALHEHLMWTSDVLTADEAKAVCLVSGIGDLSVTERTVSAMASLPPEIASTLKRSTRVDVATPLRERMAYESRLASVAAR